MSRDYINIGPTPANEPCESIGPNYDSAKARKECFRFIEQLRKQFGDEPTGASLRIRIFAHDFGNYMEVVCYYEDTDEVATKYAFDCEGGDVWENWQE